MSTVTLAELLARQGLEVTSNRSSVDLAREKFARYQGPWSYAAAPTAQLVTEREPMSAGGCHDRCGAHDRPCLLRAHDGHHYCARCPWPAARRMVRRGPR